MTNIASSIPEVLDSTPSVLDTRRFYVPFMDLGPPDIIHINKSIDSNILETYLYQIGTPSINLETLSAWSMEFINTIKNQLWFGKKKNVQIHKLTVIMYDKFSNLDIKVEVNLPGGVKWSILEVADEGANSEGNTEGEPASNEQTTEYTSTFNKTKEITQEELTLLSSEDIEMIWLELYVTNVVKSLITLDQLGESQYCDSIIEMRRLNPFQEAKSLDYFLKGFELLFEKGPLLGGGRKTLYDNHLIDSLYICASITDAAASKIIPVLERIHLKYPVISIVLARMYSLANLELKSIKFVHDELCKDPFNADLIHYQAQYLVKRGQHNLALPLAKKSVNLNPLFAPSWYTLVEVMIHLKMFKEALLTLNSIPINIVVTSGQDMIGGANFKLKKVPYGTSKIDPPNDKYHLPSPPKNLDLKSLNKSIIGPEFSLNNLKSLQLNQQFKQVYELLSKIIQKVSWSKILDLRSEVFVMASGEEGQNLENTANDKVICEHWFDNLFQLIFNDLKVANLVEIDDRSANPNGGIEDSSTEDINFKGEKQLKMIIDKYLPNSLSANNPKEESKENDNEKPAGARSSIEYEIIGKLFKQLNIKDSIKFFNKSLLTNEGLNYISMMEVLHYYFDLRNKAFKKVNAKGLKYYQQQQQEQQQERQQDGPQDLHEKAVNTNDLLLVKSIKLVTTSSTYGDYTKISFQLINLVYICLIWCNKWYIWDYPPLMYDCVKVIVRDFGEDLILNEAPDDILKGLMNDIIKTLQQS